MIPGVGSLQVSAHTALWGSLPALGRSECVIRGTIDWNPTFFIHSFTLTKCLFFSLSVIHALIMKIDPVFAKTHPELYAMIDYFDKSQRQRWDDKIEDMTVVDAQPDKVVFELVIHDYHCNQ